MVVPRYAIEIWLAQCFTASTAGSPACSCHWCWAGVGLACLGFAAATVGHQCPVCEAGGGMIYWDFEAPTMGGSAHMFMFWLWSRSWGYQGLCCCLLVPIRSLSSGGGNRGRGSPLGLYWLPFSQYFGQRKLSLLFFFSYTRWQFWIAGFLVPSLGCLGDEKKTLGTYRIVCQILRNNIIHHLSILQNPFSLSVN